MTTQDEFALTDDATKMTDLYVRAMNSGDVEAVQRLYTEDAVAIWEPGSPHSGRAHRDGIGEFMAAKPVMHAKVRESYITDDTALLVVDWAVDMTGENGETMHLEGVGLDVLRLGADGKWRYAIDNACFGQDA